MEGLTTHVMDAALRQDEEYQKYVKAQINKSLDMAFQNRRQLFPRTVYLVGLLDRVLGPDRDGLSALCVGCRSVDELDHVTEVCRINARGLDLFSENPRITAGDMHDMPFPDATFDVVYSCHSLEHAYDLDVALGEFLRVIKPGGVLVIEVPVHFKIVETDRWDLKSCDGLLAKLGQSVDAVLVREETDKVARVLVRVKAPSPVNVAR